MGLLLAELLESLAEFDREFVEFEQVLYGAERYYRDHFLHVIRVWLTGLLVMTDGHHLPISKFSFDIPDKCKDPGQSKDPVFEFELDERMAMWTIIALCHDLGYPLEKIGAINAPLRKMLSAVGKVQVRDFAYDFPSQHQFIDDFVVRFISSKLKADPPETDMSFKTEIQSKYYLKLSKSFEQLRHGILSCVLLMKRLVFFLESDFDVSPTKKLELEDARQFLIRREILRAIATHTCRDIYHLRCDTFSFLLIMCDELQEWGRPTLNELRGQPERELTTALNTYNGKCVESTFTVSAPSHDETYIRDKFRQLHKILRSAVYVQERHFSCKWSFILENGAGSRKTYVFEHTEKNVSRVLIDGKSKPNWLYGPSKKVKK